MDVLDERSEMGEPSMLGLAVEGGRSDLVMTASLPGSILVIAAAVKLKAARKATSPKMTIVTSFILARMSTAELGFQWRWFLYRAKRLAASQLV